MERVASREWAESTEGLLNEDDEVRLRRESSRRGRGGELMKASKVQWVGFAQGALTGPAFPCLPE